MLETERTVTTSGGGFSAEEGVADLGTLVPEAEEAGALPLDLPSPFIVRATCKALQEFKFKKFNNGDTISVSKIKLQINSIKETR